MKLSIHDRIVVSGLLPEKGNIVSVKLVREAREALAITADEVESLSFVLTPEGNASWDASAEAATGPTDIALPDAAQELVRQSLHKLDASGSLTVEHIRAWDMFLGRETE